MDMKESTIRGGGRVASLSHAFEDQFKERVAFYANLLALNPDARAEYRAFWAECRDMYQSYLEAEGETVQERLRRFFGCYLGGSSPAATEARLSA